MSSSAEAKAPRTRYFRAASWLSRRRWRAVAARTYRGRETISRVTKRLMRSPTAGKSIMPARQKSARGKTSVVVHPARVDSDSSALPGRSAAWAAKAPSPTVVRSAMTSSARKPMTSRTPWATTDRPSSTSPRPEGRTAARPVRSGSRRATQRTARTTPEARSASRLRTVWVTWRARRGTKASTRTPNRPAPRIMRTGPRPAQLMTGAVKLTGGSLP